LRPPSVREKLLAGQPSLARDYPSCIWKWITQKNRELATLAQKLQWSPLINGGFLDGEVQDLTFTILANFLPK
jgi:hypothetical protein